MSFDASRIELDDLLTLFWAGHDPTRAAHSRQYRSAVFCQDAEQLALVEESAAREAEKRGREIRTEISLGAPFHEAEDYHQKWYLRRHPQLLDQLIMHYQSEGEALASIAAARLNGYLGGAGTAKQLERDVDRLGLDGASQSYLRRCVGRKV